MLCLNTPKQLETVFVTLVFIETSESRYMPRSRTEATGVTSSSPIMTDGCGIWCCRLLEAHHNTSVFAVFSCSRLLRIHNATSSAHAEICCESWYVAECAYC